MADKCYKCGVNERASSNSYCRDCNKAYNRERLQKKRDYVNAYKLERGCAKCGYNAHPVALELNHIDPSTKKYNISRQLISITMPKLLEELGKCEVLCAICHQIHTYENKHHLS